MNYRLEGQQDILQCNIIIIGFRQVFKARCSLLTLCRGFGWLSVPKGCYGLHEATFFSESAGKSKSTQQTVKLKDIKIRRLLLFVFFFPQKYVKPLARLQRFFERCHGSVYVLRLKGHGSLHHQHAAVTHRVVHALRLPEGDRSE